MVYFWTLQNEFIEKRKDDEEQKKERMKDVKNCMNGWMQCNAMQEWK